MSEKIYGDRDLMAMDRAGNYYCRHVAHMTRENLHSKSDIAAELGWRDMQIANLQQQLTDTTNILKSAGIEADTVQAGVMGLKAQRDALAAENAALKELATGYADLADSRLSEITANCESDCRRECYEACNKTPATDAYLNAVRAEALRDFAKEADKKAEAFSASARATNDFYEDQRFRFAAAMFRGFARQLRTAQLRAGNAGKDGSHE